MSKYNKKTVRLGDVATYVNGYAFKPSDWNTTGIPIIRIQDLTGSSCNPNYYQGEYNEKFLVDNEDVLISWSASLGVYVWDKGKALLNQHIFKVVFDKCEIEKCYYVFSVRQKLMDMVLRSRGATMKHIVKKDFENIRIPFPSKKMQKQIAGILMRVDSLLLMRKNQLLYLDRLVKSQFIEMFGDPIINPMKWKVKKLKEISLLIINGNTPKGGSSVYVKNGIMFFRSQNIWRNKIELEDVAYIDVETHKKMKNTSIKNRDILITKTGRINTENSSLGRAAMYIGEDDKANINGHVYLIRLKDNIVNDFILFIITTDKYREYIRSICVGGIDKRQLNKDHIENFPIILPPIELQNKFADFVRQVDKSKYRVYNSRKIINNLIEGIIHLQ